MDDNDSLAIRELPGYRAGLVDEPVFGGRAYVVEAGPADGAPVLLVHGVGEAGARDWDTLIPRLADRHRVLAFDLPGFGRSTHANVNYTPKRYREFIDFITRERIGDRFAVVGHSMGGALSLLYAGTRAERVERLVLADVAGVLHREAFAEYMAYLGVDRIPGLDSGLGGRMQRLVHNWVRPLTRLEPDPSLLLEVGKIRQKLLRGDPTKIAALGLILHNFGEAIAGVRAPTLLIWGARDNLAPLRTGRLLAARIPGAPLETIPDCGHVPMREAPERFGELVQRRLAADLHEITAAPEPRPANESERLGRVGGERGRTLTGDYDRIDIEGSSGIVLDRVRARQLIVRDSDVSLEDVEIEGQALGLGASGSRIRATGGHIEADAAIELVGSDLDFAGTAVHGRRSAVRAGGEQKSDALFSVCPVSSPAKQGHLHGIYRIVPGREI
jgi:pimeloyl-ACP methyl ester carboxylesterase